MPKRKLPNPLSPGLDDLFIVDDTNDELSEDISHAPSSPTMTTKRATKYPLRARPAKARKTAPEPAPKLAPNSTTTATEAQNLLSKLTTTVNSLETQLQKAKDSASSLTITKCSQAAQIEELERQVQQCINGSAAVEEENSDLIDENDDMRVKIQELQEDLAEERAKSDRQQDQTHETQKWKTQAEKWKDQAKKWEGLTEYWEAQAVSKEICKRQAEDLSRLAKGLIESNGKGDFMAAGAFMRDLAKAVEGEETTTSIKQEK